MNLYIFEKYKSGIESEPVEMIERKGIGHPDTLADIIAEEFSNRYSAYTLDKFGYICNHVVDKVTVLGAKTRVEFGKYKIIKPITVCLFGKTTSKVGNNKINIKKIFKESVKNVFMSIFKTDDILKHTKYLINTHDGIGFDHPAGFYNPSSQKDLEDVNSELKSNDTVMCSAYAPYSQMERLTIDIENFLNSEKFKQEFPETGYDIKVLTTKVLGQKTSITICVPFLAKLTPNKVYYAEKIKEIRVILEKYISVFLGNDSFDLNINTKDDNGKYAYLTVYGSALDKGDQGAVGRGNRYNGVISVNREMNIEAPAGKNPIHHSGKIYNAIAFNIAMQIYHELGLENYVNISVNNGDPLNNPAFIIIKIVDDIGKNENKIKEIVSKNFQNMQNLTDFIILTNPIKEHIERSYERYNHE